MASSSTTKLARKREGVRRDTEWAAWFTSKQSEGSLIMEGEIRKRGKKLALAQIERSA